MNALANAILGLVAAALLVAVPVGSTASESPPTTATSSPMLFGMDAAGVSAQTAAGIKPDYGTFWIGPWTLSSGWGGPDAQLASMKAAGVTPAIHFYYWGDDISPSCVENGCWSSLHNAQKTRAGWETLGKQLTDHLNSKMGGAPVVVFLESEFNKGGIETYEPFDGYMAAMTDKIHAAYPNAIVVLGFGNWGSHAWSTFDRAAAASDMVGIQGMRGSTKQSQSDMYTLYDGLLAGVKTLGAKFPDKPIMLTDIAVSSYPEPGYVSVQAGVLKEVFDNLGTLRALGVQAMIYRSWKDSPTMDTANYYGQAERHWGLAWASNGTVKASGKVWTEGVKAVRTEQTNDAPVAAFTASVSGLTASLDAGASGDADGDALTYAWAFGDGTTGTGRTASHAYGAAGTYTVTLTVRDAHSAASASRSVTVEKPNSAPAAAFTATASGLSVAVDGSASSDADGQALTHAWTFGDGSSASGAKATHTYASAGTYTVTLTVKDGLSGTAVSKAVTVKAPYTATFTTRSASNENWIQEKVVSSPAPAKVDVQVNGGAWQPMKLQSYGDWTLATKVVKGSTVVFRATAPDGQTATSSPQPWLGAATPTTTSSTTTTSKASTTTTTSATSTTTTTTTATAFKATFTPKAVGNDWWVETAVTANQGIAKVEAKVGSSGTWTPLAKQDWGNYAKSLNAPNGSYVQFRATSPTGATSTSATYIWS